MHGAGFRFPCAPVAEQGSISKHNGRLAAAGSLTAQIQGDGSICLEPEDGPSPQPPAR